MVTQDWAIRRLGEQQTFGRSEALSVLRALGVDTSTLPELTEYTAAYLKQYTERAGLTRPQQDLHTR